MEEIEILKQYLAGQKVSSHLKMSIDYWAEGPEKQKFIEEKHIVDSQVENLKNKLVNIPDNKYSSEAKSAIIEQFDAYIKEVGKERFGLKLSRSQNMVLENILFGFIVGDIHHLIIDKVFGIRIPAYLVYTHSNEDSVETSSVIDFLKEEIEFVNQIKNINYISLHEYFHEFTNRIRTKFIH